MSTTQQIWMDIKNYEGCYQISNKGRVKSLERGGVLRAASHARSPSVSCCIGVARHRYTTV